MVVCFSVPMPRILLSSIDEPAKTVVPATGAALLTVGVTFTVAMITELPSASVALIVNVSPGVWA